MSRRTYYGDPDDPVEELSEYDQHGPPRDGDELCDGHQMHYEWREGKWR
jgi:hypothetical protein